MKNKNSENCCNYCGACYPCPAGLDIPRINRYYDLAVQGDKDAVSAYRELYRKADDCIRCKHCNRKCPNKVSQMGRMKKIKEYFAGITD
ncbi:MAG: 4Fe-4S dicluster domain-containing protein [Lachnospiraceae bacterium]|nr:4Fe-4S dicluster domain-containing protein [Lachnospiraceae bacterium]